MSRRRSGRSALTIIPLNFSIFPTFFSRPFPQLFFVLTEEWRSISRNSTLIMLTAAKRSAGLDKDRDLFTCQEVESQWVISFRYLGTRLVCPPSWTPEHPLPHLSNLPIIIWSNSRNRFDTSSSCKWIYFHGCWRLGHVQVDLGKHGRLLISFVAPIFGQRLYWFWRRRCASWSHSTRINHTA